LPDIGAFYTADKLREKSSEGEIEKMHMFMFGNGGTPSVRDARLEIEFSFSSSFYLFFKHSQKIPPR
jgi:hypothetical protein